MNILLVGAGAVGQVFGLHLARGGAKVALFVKPKYEEAARQGFKVQALRGRNKDPQLFVPDAVHTTIAAVAAERFDHVLLCVSSTGLRGGPWLSELAPAIGHATVAAIQPGLDDAAFVGELIPADRLAWGMFPLVSFIEGGVTKYYLPPFAKVPWSGAGSRELARAFSRGGLPSRVAPDVHASIAFGSVLINLHMAALECARWSLSAIRGDRELLQLLHGAIAEAMRIVAQRRKTKPPWLLGRFRPWTTRVAAWIAPKVSPFALEDYLRLHFSKVGDQTAANLATVISAGGAANLPTQFLERITERLEKTRAP